MDLGLKGKTAWVSGASRGIGLAVARRLLEEGARVFLTARGAESLEEARSALASSFGADRVHALVADAAETADCAAAAKASLAAFGTLDVLVLNAGTGRVGGGDAPSEADFRAAFAANLRPAHETLAAALEGLRASKSGAVVAVGSIAGLEDLGAPAAYAAAKSALHSWVKTAARDLAASGVRLNAVVPGNILFQGGVWDVKRKENPEAVAGYIKREVPMGRFGTPDEMADAAAFLASPRASFITGALLVADGGQTRRLS
ncbi:MAG: SDR family oxidoreductase [Elusimicrobia bacterium]|nr:SDR family oxidoreductase [Elusimicrobiota bacterium]